MIEQVDVVSLRTVIVDQLRNRILSGAVAPGERLNERILSEQFGVSRPPLREAIRQLEAEGLLISQARRGTYVRTFSPRDVRELYALRYALEAAAAEFIAESHSPQMLAELEQRLDEIHETVSAGIQLTIEADLRFHREIVRATGLDQLITIWEQLAREVRLALIFVDPEFFGDAFVEETHRPLLAAIKAKDYEQIRRCTAELRKVGDALGDRWEEINSRPTAMSDGTLP